MMSSEKNENFYLTIPSNLDDVHRFLVHILSFSKYNEHIKTSAHKATEKDATRKSKSK